MATKTAEEVVGALFKEWIARYEVPEVSDNGLEFRNKLLESLSAKLGVRRHFSAPYHPKTNGLCERVHRFAKQALGSMLDGKHKQWDEYLPMLAFAHRTSPVVGLGFSPYEMVMGRKAKLPGVFSIDEYEEVPKNRRRYVKSLSKALARMQKVMDVRQAMTDERAAMAVNDKRKELDIAPGTMVLVRRSTPLRGWSRNLEAKWSEPYEVVTRAHNNPNVYVVAVDGKHKRVNVEDLHVLSEQRQDAPVEGDEGTLFLEAPSEEQSMDATEVKGIDESEVKAEEFVVLEELTGEKSCFLARAINDGGAGSPVEYHIFSRHGESARFYPVWLRTNARGNIVRYIMPKAGANDEPLLVIGGREWKLIRRQVQLESGKLGMGDIEAMGDDYERIPTGQRT
jgi:hypothetical protein